MGCHSSKPACHSSSVIHTVRPAEAETNMPPCYEEFHNLLRDVSNTTYTQQPNISVKDTIFNNPSLICFVRDVLKSQVSAKNLLAAISADLAYTKNMHANKLQTLQSFQIKEKFDENPHGKLKHFMEIEAAGAPLTTEFSLTHEKLTRKITRKKDEIKRKLERSKKWKKMAKIVLNVAFGTVLALSIVLAAVSMQANVTTIIAAGSNLIKAGEAWLDLAWASHLEGLEGEKDVMLAIHRGLLEFRFTQELESIWEMVHDLKLNNGLINTRFAINSDTEEVIRQMEKRVEACNGEIRKMITEFLKIIVE